MRQSHLHYCRMPTAVLIFIHSSKKVFTPFNVKFTQRKFCRGITTRRAAYFSCAAGNGTPRRESPLPIRLIGLSSVCSWRSLHHIRPPLNA